MEEKVETCTHVIEIGKKWRLIAFYRNDNCALKRDKSPIFCDIFSDLSPIILIVNHGIITTKYAPNPNRLGLG